MPWDAHPEETERKRDREKESARERERDKERKKKEKKRQLEQEKRETEQVSLVREKNLMLNRIRTNKTLEMEGWEVVHWIWIPIWYRFPVAAGPELRWRPMVSSPKRYSGVQLSPN